MTPPKIYQHGVALVSAIFLLVVLAALGAYMVGVSGVQQTTGNQAILGARVYFAAQSGLEWGIQRVISTPAGATAVPCFASPTNIALEADISVSVTCAKTDHAGGGTTYSFFYLTSTATHGTAGNPDYAERRLETTVSNY